VLSLLCLFPDKKKTGCTLVISAVTIAERAWPNNWQSATLHGFGVLVFWARHYSIQGKCVRQIEFYITFAPKFLKKNSHPRTPRATEYTDFPDDWTDSIIGHMYCTSQQCYGILRKRAAFCQRRALFFCVCALVCLDITCATSNEFCVFLCSWL